MQLFIVSIRAATPSKSRGEISIRGDGCDTPRVTVIATVSEWQLTMYFGSFNEILASLVCT
jgi:hypothetical protein